MATNILSAENGNTHNQPATPERLTTRFYWTFTYEVGGDIIVAEVLDKYTGKYRVIEHIASDLCDNDMPGHCPHAFLRSVQERKGKIISNEPIHIVTDFDFDGVTRAELESFISALINHVENIIFTPMSTKLDFNEFIHENRP